MPNQPDDATWSAIAATAYNAFNSVVGFQGLQGQPMPSFDKLPEAFKQAWEKAAKTVGECLQSPEMITADQRQTGQRIVDDALQKIEENDA